MLEIDYPNKKKYTVTHNIEENNSIKNKVLHMKTKPSHCKEKKISLWLQAEKDCFKKTQKAQTMKKILVNITMLNFIFF